MYIELLNRFPESVKHRKFDLLGKAFTFRKYIPGWWLNYDEYVMEILFVCDILDDLGGQILDF